MQTELKNTEFEIEAQRDETCCIPSWEIISVNADVSVTDQLMRCARRLCVCVDEIRVSGRKGNFITTPPNRLSLLYILSAGSWVGTFGGSLSILRCIQEV
jgi:hypothetical protein